jgi:flavin-dependent dehydrogenase
MYDVIVVGARCAGSPTAMLLGRRDYRVLLVDKSTFPSDMALSTHLVHQPGVARLKRWDLLEQVITSNCPPITTYYFDFNAVIPGVVLDGSPPPADGVKEAYAPRRRILDSILVNGAVQSGVEVREGFSFQELVWDQGRVTGIRGRDRHGAAITEKATIVVGADGMNSTVARAVQAPEYHAKPPLAGPYFAYWSGVPMNGFEFYPGEGRGAFGWMTNDDLALIGVGWTASEFQAVRTDVEGNYLRAIEVGAPGLAERVRSGQRRSSFAGIKIPNYFRRPYGPGWALVGDAGYQKDPSTAMGISDAFRCAELLAAAIDAGLSGRRPLAEALADYERERNEMAMPMYDLTCQLATMEFSAEMCQLLTALQGNQEQTNRFFGLIAQTTPVPEFFAPENVERIFAAARLRESSL